MDRWFYVYNELKRKVESRGEITLDPASDACKLFDYVAGGLKGKRDLDLIKHLELSCEFVRQQIRFMDVNKNGQFSFMSGFESALMLLLYAARRR